MAYSGDAPTWKYVCSIMIFPNGHFKAESTIFRHPQISESHSYDCIQAISMTFTVGAAWAVFVSLELFAGETWLEKCCVFSKNRGETQESNNIDGYGYSFMIDI